MTDRDCMTCGTIGCGHQDAMRCGVMLADWTPKKQALLTEDALLKKLREYASTPEFSVNLQANIEAERIRHEEWERKQREWWNKHKHDIYDI